MDVTKLDEYILGVKYEADDDDDDDDDENMIHTYIYIYVYIYTERERETVFIRFLSPKSSTQFARFSPQPLRIFGVNSEALNICNIG